ncbi:MAG: NAD(P)-dependent oxidoreductase [Halioglobus sp.]
MNLKDLLPKDKRLLFTVFLCLSLLSGCGSKPDLSAFGNAAPPLANDPAALNILVIGGTSGIGLETVKLALQRGHRVTAMARRPERMTLEHANLSIIAGDVTNSKDVIGALNNNQAVVFTIGIKPTRDTVSVFSQGTQNVLSAMASDNSQRLIMVTGIGAGESRGHGGFFYDRLLQPLLLKTMYEDKDRSEALIYASEVPWTIVRPGFLVDTDSEAKYRVIESMNGVVSGDIARADVAHYLLWALESGAHTGKTIFLSN